MYTRNATASKEQSFWLFGPRGVGKSNWVQLYFKNSLLIDLLHARTFNELLTDPSKLEEKIESGSYEWVVLDEVQKIPELLNEVHRLIEKKKIKFVLTGSSARKLRKAGVNLLAGRAITKFMYPLSVRELGTDFSFQKSLKTGHLPMAYTSSNPDDYLQSYIKTYMKEEIYQEGFTRNLAAFSRFLETASFSQGQYLNITKVASEAMVDRKLVEQYFILLEDMLLSWRLPIFTKKAKRKTTAHPKFFFFDLGIYKALRPRGPLDSEAEIDGPAHETLVLQELKAENEYQEWGYTFYSWQVNRGPDVDLVLYGKRGLIAIEVKRTDRLRGGELDGLKLFQKDYPMAKCFFIFSGKEKKNIDGIQIIPIEDFLHNLHTIF